MSKVKFLDKTGVELKVGDQVKFGKRQGEVLLLQEFPTFNESLRLCYVSKLGLWDSPLAVRAERLEKL